MASDSDLLAVRNDNADEWQNVEIVIYGFMRSGGPPRRTRPYKSRIQRIRANSVELVSLDDFKNAAGQPWSRLGMRPEAVDVHATRRGARCATADVRVSGADK
jgi:hypothetical protein